MVPLTCRWEPFKRSAFFIEAIKPLVFPRLQKGDAYTTSPQLSEHVVLTEAINLKTFSIGFGGAFEVYTNKKKNQFTLNLSSGYCSEKFIVHYRQYDNKNYEVLNPDVSESFTGLYASVAGLYTFHKRNRFIMLRIQSNSSARRNDRYPISYDLTSPLQLTYGLNFIYTKK